MFESDERYFFCKKTKLLDFRQRHFPVLILMTAVKSYQVMTNLVIDFSYDIFWYQNNMKWICYYILNYFLAKWKLCFSLTQGLIALLKLSIILFALIAAKRQCEFAKNTKLQSHGIEWSCTLIIVYNKKQNEKFRRA